MWAVRRVDLPRLLSSVLALALSAGLLAACGAGTGQTPSGTIAPSPTQASTTTAAPATTTTTIPPRPQPSAAEASNVFMEGWIYGHRSESESVATPAAVATLYAKPYGGQPLNDRGCRDSFPPVVCTWGPYALGHGAIYQVQVTRTASGWYVSGLTIEG